MNVVEKIGIVLVINQDNQMKVVEIKEKDYQENVKVIKDFEQVVSS